MLDIFESAALAAGQEIMAVYRAGAHVSYKNDCSPVTEADRRAEDIILSRLAQSFPAIPVIAEEAVAAGNIPATTDEGFFLVDPLDGTKEFINRQDDFTVNIAFIRDGMPVAGIVYAPAKKIAYTGSVQQQAQKLAISDDFTIVGRKTISVRQSPALPVALLSRSHCNRETEAFVQERGITECSNIGSSLKFCLLAEGKADIYPRFSPTMKWDTAAGDAVLRAAGGITLTADGHPLPYPAGMRSAEDLFNPSFIAWGNAPSG